MYSLPGPRTMLGRISRAVLFASLVFTGSIPVFAQLRPEVTPPPKRAPAKKKPAPSQPEKPAEAKPTQIVVETSPGGHVYLDDAFKGEASSEGRLVIDSPRPGDHTLRVSLAGRKDYEQQVTVKAGEIANVQARLADIEKPKPVGVAAGTVRENPKDGLKYVWIPPGTFQMGCSPGDNECAPHEKPAHQVTISKGFWIGQTEVTAGAYKRFADGTGKAMPSAPAFNSGWSNGQMPIVTVSWDDAQAYCTWAGGRLPTEAEWEYAARGESTEARYGPLDEVAWYGSNSGAGTHPVGEKRANTFGLFDALGNVWEWVSDWYDYGYYATSTAVDPSGPASGTERVLRGGSCYGLPRGVRVSNRNRNVPGLRVDAVGFRCVGEAISR